MGSNLVLILLLGIVCILSVIALAILSLAQQQIPPVLIATVSIALGALVALANPPNRSP